MFLAYDTETSGLFDFKKPLDEPSQPHLVQLGAALYDNEFREISSMRLRVQPDGWTISQEAEAIHGISTRDVERTGMPLVSVLSAFLGLVAVTKHTICHNREFDENVIQSELIRMGAKDRGLKRPRLRKHCTMVTGAALMDDGLYPRLPVLLDMLTAKELVEAHDGLADARAAMDCFIALTKLDLIEL